MRFWRVTQAVRFALSRRAMPGRTWDLFVGHLTFCGLVVRDVLSALHAVYIFIRKHCSDRVPLWATAREGSDWAPQWRSYHGN